MLTTGPIRGHVIALATPVAAAMVLQSLYALIDLAWVGRLGGEAVAGLGISLQAFFLVLAISQVVATAMLARVSRRYGAGEVQEAWRDFAGFVLAAMAVGALAAGAAWFSAEQYVATFTADPAVQALGLSYFRITSVTFLLQMMLMVVGTGMRASGDFNTPMKVMAASVSVNLVLDPLLIFGIGPLPAMGLPGAAWATVAAQCCALLIYVWLLSRAPSDGRALRWARPRLDRRMAGELVTRGLPAGLQHLLLSVVMGLVLAAMKPYGALWTATAGGGFRIVQQTLLPLVAIGFAAAALSGQNLGAGRHDRIIQTARTALGWGGVYAVILSLALYFGGRWAGHVFATTPAELDVAQAYFHWSAPMTVAFAASMIPTMMLQGVGRSLPPLVGAAVKVTLLAFMVLWVIPTWGLAPKYVFGAATLSYLAEGAVDLWLLRRYLSGLDAGPPADLPDAPLAVV